MGSKKLTLNTEACGVWACRTCRPRDTTNGGLEQQPPDDTKPLYPHQAGAPHRLVVHLPVPGFQKCMRQTSFDLERCQWEAERLKACCAKFKANGVSTHCAFYDDDVPPQEAPGE